MIKKEDIFSSEEQKKELFLTSTASITESMDKLEIRASDYTIFKQVVDIIEHRLLDRIISKIENKEDADKRD